MPYQSKQDKSILARDGEKEGKLLTAISHERFLRLTTLTPFCFFSLGSTQTFLSDELNSTREGEFVVSRVQEQGKGRQERRWISDEGGLWLSLTLAPPPQILERITLAAANAVERTLRENLALSNCYIKLPNDVYCNGKKIAGILTDARISGSSTIVYLGIGVNLNNDVTSLAGMATSYLSETGKNADLTTFTVKLLKNLDSEYDELLQKEDWCEASEANLPQK